MVNGSNYSRDSINESDTSSFRKDGGLGSRKRVRRATGVKTLLNTCYIEVYPPTGSVNISSGVKAVSLLDII